MSMPFAVRTDTVRLYDILIYFLSCDLMIECFVCTLNITECIYIYSHFSLEMFCKK